MPSTELGTKPVLSEHSFPLTPILAQDLLLTPRYIPVEVTLGGTECTKLNLRALYLTDSPFTSPHIILSSSLRPAE